MIDNPENGQVPEMRDKEAESVKSTQTATAVEEADKPASEMDDMRSEQPSPSHPGWNPRTQPPVTEPAQTAQSERDQSMAKAEPLPAAAEPISETDFSSELVKFRKRFEEILAEFIGEPRAAVDKAETLIDGLVDALRNQLQNIHSKIEAETDTEQLRVAMLSYRELFDSLGGHRAA